MSAGAFTDKSRRPKKDEVTETLGSSFTRWTSLVEFLRRSCAAAEDFKFLYGCSYGWALRFRNKGKLLTSLFPNRGYFVAQIILNKNGLKDANGLKLHKNALNAIKTANPYPEGKWLFIPMKSDVDVRDAKALIGLKA